MNTTRSSGDMRTPDEARRVAALKELMVLDSLPEQAYDDLTRAAAQLCGTPVALISLIDSHRQWFKAKVGIDVTETPREIAFCAHTIQTPNEVMVVNDATKDARFAANPLVTEDPGIRFYAGAPLVTASGEAIGTLCVIDDKPHDGIDPQKLETLQFLARQVMQALELRASRLGDNGG